MVWFVSCFIPYPAIPLGNTSCINFAHLLLPFVLLTAPWGSVDWRKGLKCVALALGCILVSTITNISFNPNFDVGLGLKGFVSMGSFFVQVLGGMVLAALGYRRVCLSLMLALGINGAMSIVQFIFYFLAVFFPFPEIYNHYAFSDPANMFEAYGRPQQPP